MRMRKEVFSKKNGFITPIVFYIFYFLERVSVFYWVRVLGEKIHKKFGKNTNQKAFVKEPIFPEIWLVGNVILAILVERTAQYIRSEWLLWIILIYSLERIFEMFIYQVNVLFFHRMTPVFFEVDQPVTNGEKKDKSSVAVAGEYKITSYTRTVIMLLLNMFEYVLQFAAAFSIASTLMGEPGIRVGIVGSFEIFMNMVNSEELFKNNILTFAYVETIIGMFMNLVCLARFIGILPEVKEVGIKAEQEK